MANFNFNKVILGGRLTADPELKTTQSGVSVTSFTIAIARRFGSGEETQTDFVNCQAWRQTAELITRYFKKGSSISVVGSLQTRSWTDNSGTKRYVTEVVVDEIYFVDSKGESGANSRENRGGKQKPAQSQKDAKKPQNTTPQLEEITNDEDLPF